MLKTIKKKWRYSDTDDKVVFFGIAIFGTILVVAIGWLIYLGVYEATLDYRERPATVVQVTSYNEPGVMVGYGTGTTVKTYQQVCSESGDRVVYEDEDGNRFTEEFSDGTELVVGDKVIIGVGYDGDKETDYVKFIDFAQNR